MAPNFSEIENEAKAALLAAKTLGDLENFRVAFVGKKGKVADLFACLKDLNDTQKREYGQKVNLLKQSLLESYEAKLSELSARPVTENFFDETLPGICPPTWKMHPITQTIIQITKILERLGFEIVEGPEVETEFHNFTALNIPLDHPSRDSFDTFYTEHGQLLRSQTSPVQIRVMETRKPPLRIIAPGRVYRPDAVDASHSFMFHQIEGLMVDDKTTFSDLKGVLHLFLKELFGNDVKIRFRPHFFPFTEPSVEVDIKWGKSWLEILGAGSVHPNVFRAVGYDPKKVQGFAFGLGVERMAMNLYGIPDIRYFYENDIRFLKQF